MCTSEKKLSKGQQEFIGTTFCTPKGGVLTVVGKDSGKKPEGICWNNKFTLECSICSKDQELWPEGSIKHTKGSLVNGRIPCGCSNRPQCTEEQTKIRVIRECAKRGYVFLGWSRGYKGTNRTKLGLENPETGNRWYTTSCSSFLRGHGDPNAGKESSRQASLIEDSQHIKAFMDTGTFLEGTKFTRSERQDTHGRKPYWNLSCPKCSGDEYVLNGLCNGVFPSTSSSLKNGSNPCRCSDKFHWTQEQREFQINKVFHVEGGSFTGWEVDSYKNANSKFNWVCSEGHKCQTSVNGLLSAGTRCPICAKQRQKELAKESGVGYGHYPHRTTEQDNLYIIRFKKDGVIKVGRSFNVNKRIPQLLTISDHELSDIEILYTMTGTHQEVYDTEQFVHEELTDRGFHKPLEWTQECFTEDSENMIYRLLDESVLSEGEW